MYGLIYNRFLNPGRYNSKENLLTYYSNLKNNSRNIENVFKGSIFGATGICFANFVIQSNRLFYFGVLPLLLTNFLCTGLLKKNNDSIKSIPSKISNLDLPENELTELIGKLSEIDKQW